MKSAASLKHVREAVRLAGAEGVEFCMGGKHPFLLVNGRRVTVSASPKDPDFAARNIAKDIHKARAS